MSCVEEEARKIPRSLLVATLWCLLAMFVLRSVRQVREGRLVQAAWSVDLAGLPRWDEGPAVTLCPYRATVAALPTGKTWTEEIRPFFRQNGKIATLGNITELKLEATEHTFMLTGGQGWEPRGVECLTIEDKSDDPQPVFSIGFRENDLLLEGEPVYFVLHGQGQFIVRYAPVFGAQDLDVQAPGLGMDVGIDYEMSREQKVPVAASSGRERRAGPSCDVGNRQRTGDCLWERLVVRPMGCESRIRHPARTDTAKSVYELCDPDDPDVASTYKSLYFQIQETTMAELLNKTGCRKNCHFTRYSVIPYKTERTISPDLAWISVSSGQAAVEVTADVPKYGLSEALTDVGGFLGLLLGASILGAYDNVERLAKQALRGKTSRN